MSEHAKEPWLVEHERTDYGALITIIRNANYEYAVGECGVDCDAARRIVSCVNALAGMNPDALADVVEAAERLLLEIVWQDDEGLAGEAEPVVKLRTALAKLRGEA